MLRSVTADELSVTLTPLADAVAQVVDSFRPLAPVVSPLNSAAGLLLANDVVSTVSVPSVPTSTMDGYAVCAVETSGVVSRYEKVMTGAPLPTWADVVAPWEVASEHANELDVAEALEVGTFVRPPGVDVQAGETVLHAGQNLTAIALGVAASIGVASVSVVPRPKVAVLSTGDELVAPGSVPVDGSVFDSNSAMLSELLRNAGADVVSVALVADDRDAITAWMQGVAPSVDFIVTSGGASVGERDWMRTILSEDGSLHLWRVALKPGKPFAYGTFADTPVFALPGNPASVLACTHAFVKPVIRLLSGHGSAHRSQILLLGGNVHAPDDRVFLLPVWVQTDVAFFNPASGSSTLSNHLRAEAYALIPPGGMHQADEVVVEYF